MSDHTVFNENENFISWNESANSPYDLRGKANAGPRGKLIACFESTLAFGIKHGRWKWLRGQFLFSTKDHWEFKKKKEERVNNERQDSMNQEANTVVLIHEGLSDP